MNKVYFFIFFSLVIFACSKNQKHNNFLDDCYQLIITFPEYIKVRKLMENEKLEKPKLVFVDNYELIIEGSNYMVFEIQESHESHNVVWNTYAIPFDKSLKVLVHDTVQNKFVPRSSYLK